MFLLLAEIAFVVGNGLYRYYTRPDDPKPKQLDDFTFPRAEEGDAVPLAYGTNRIDSPIVIYFAIDDSYPINGDPNQGFEYQMTARLLLCRSNARVDDASPLAPHLIALFVSGKQANLTGPNWLGDNGGLADPPGASSWYVVAPSGSEFGGSIFTTPFFYDGRWDLVRRPDEDVTFTHPDDVDVPYRGHLTLLFRSMLVGGGQLPTMAPVVYNPVCIPGYEAETGMIGSGDCNPMAILWDLWTNPWGGCGNDATTVDIASFLACASVLATEQCGMSLLVTKPNEARSLMEEVLRVINGVGYIDMSTGKFVVNLIRADYDPDTIPEFTISNCVEAPQMPSSLWSDTVNEVKVIYTEPRNGYRPATATEQDLAGIAINGGRVRSTELRFPGIRNPTLAQNIAARELNALSRPLARLMMKVNRQGYNLKPGDPFKFTWSRWGVSLVFRVMEVDLGTLEDGTITVTAIQDQFSIVGTAFDPPVIDEIGDPPAQPSPIQSRLVTECPRWIQVQAYDQALVTSPDAQRSYSLAVAAGDDNRYKLDTTINLADETADLPPRAFPTTFTSSLSYNRTAGPYDTVVGILIDTLVGDDLASATATQIREEGRNLFALWDDDGNHEILAFEAAADLGAGAYQLQTVWRGLLDTVPRDWPAGTSGALLPGANAVDGMGRLALRYGSTVATRLKAASGSTWTPSAESPLDGFTARSRALLPARAQYLRLNSSQAPAAIEEGGVTFNWADRNATSSDIARGDEADQAVQSGQTFDAVAYKPTSWDPDPAQVVLSAGLSSHTTQIALGKVGHGALEVGIDTKRAVALPNGTTPTLRGWDVPTLEITAHHWRNLLLNPRFAAGSLTSWTTVGGTPGTAAATPLGSAGYYVRGTTGTVTIQQDVDVSGYPAEGLTAVLDFYASKLADSIAADDTITVTLYSLDASLATIASTVYGPASPASWTHQVLSLAALTSTTVYLRVRIVLTPVGGGDTQTDAGVTELCLRLGQVSSQLVVNPSFETGGGSLTSWNQTSGTWQVLTGTKYDSDHYARPNDGASAQLTQVMALPAGFELGVAVLECARLNDDGTPADTGKVTLAALDVGGSVVASDDTGTEAMAVSSVWERRRLTIDPIPATATQLKITVDATRVAGTPLNSGFDDFDLRCHKHLDEEQTISAEWSESVAQPLPRTASAFAFAFPAVTVPDYAIYDGALTGRLGVEPVLVSTGANVTNGATAVAWDGSTRTTTAYESVDSSAGEWIEVAPLGTSFGNFGSDEDFTVAVFWRTTPDTPGLADGFGICGRTTGGIGWQLRVTDTDGFPMAKLTGDSGSATATGTIGAADGSLHGAVMTYVAGTTTLALYDASGTHTASTAAIGEFAAGAGRLRILTALEAVAEASFFEGHVLRLYMWRSALTSTEADLLLAGIRISDASGLLGDDQRTGAIACVTGTGTTGVLVETFGPGRTAIGYDATSDEWGLVSCPDAANNYNTGTVVTNAGTVEADAAIDPLGFVQAIRISGTSAQGRSLTAIPGGDAYLQWMARSDTAHNAMVAIVDAGIDIDTHTYAVTTEWQVFTWDTTSGGDFDVRFAGSADGTPREIYLSPIIGVTNFKLYPGTFPIGSPGPTLPVLDVSTLTSQANREGEVVVESLHVDSDCAIADLHNGTNDNDRRTVLWDAGAPNIKSDHYTSAGVVSTAAQIATSAVVPKTPYTAALRWNRAGLREDVAAYVQLRADQGATAEHDAGRAATWTASTTPVDELELGHKADGSAAMAGLIVSARVSSRERKA